MSKSSLKNNVIANFVGSIWSVLMAIAFIPFYIKLMGPEAYGIVGVLVSLQSVFAILDLGLSVALNRELARLQIDSNNAERMQSTVKTFEMIYWGIACVVAFVVLGAAHFFSYFWLKPELLSQTEIQNAFFIMAIILGLRWPVALYAGGLNGLQRQVSVNILSIVTVTAQNLGALAILKFVEPTIHAFFIWQAVVAFFQVFAYRYSLKRILPIATVSRFDPQILRDIWRFAAGMSGTTILATGLTQLDKAILSKVLLLKDFGYYTFAVSIAAGIFKITVPVFTAFYPRLVELIEKKESSKLAETYHLACQVMSAFLIPAAVILIFFAQEILGVWSGDRDLVLHTSAVVSLLVVGNTLNGMMYMPYALQLAYGWTSLSFYANLVAVLVLAPGIYFGVLFFGVRGAAAAWIVLNLGYLSAVVFIMHRKILQTEMKSFYFADILLPLISCLAVVSICRLAAPVAMNKYQTIIAIFFFGAVTLLAGTVSAKSTRFQILRYLNKYV